MDSLRVLLLLIISFNLFSQDQHLERIQYEGEEYKLYPERQKINHNPTALIWEKKVILSKQELKKYKPSERRRSTH